MRYTPIAVSINVFLVIFPLGSLKFLLRIWRHVNIGTKILITSKPFRELIGAILIALEVFKLQCLLGGQNQRSGKPKAILYFI